MKKIIIAITTFIVLNGCSLDFKPESSLTYNGFWESEEAVRAAHSGIYAKFRDKGSTFWFMGEIRSDIWGGKTMETPHNSELIKNDISKTKVYFSNWNNFYGLLHYMNDFIKNAPKVSFTNVENKNHLLGQIHGLRAYTYYTMLKAWGEVPIVTEPLEKIGAGSLETLKKKRAPKTEVMTLIKSDIEKSLEYFNATSITRWMNTSVYWSKSATLALKGDVYLWSGKVLAGGSADYQVAKEALMSVSGYKLVDYDKLWGQHNEKNEEFIFALDYQQDQASNFYNITTARQVDINGKYDETGKLMNSVILNGGNYYGVSDKTLKLYDDKNDLRRNTLLRIYSDDKATQYVTSVLNKFLGIVDSGVRRQWNNVPIYRYADVLLLLAEAKNNLGEDPSTEINEVRKRAYGSKYTTTNTYTNSSQDINTRAILEERYKEFVGEGKRWWDLVRAGGNYLFEEVPSMKASEAYKIYYSISEQMIANDSELKQTEGY